MITDIQQARAIISKVGESYQNQVVDYLRSGFYDLSYLEQDRKAQRIISDMENEYSLKIANELYKTEYDKLPNYLKGDWSKNERIDN